MLYIFTLTGYLSKYLKFVYKRLFYHETEPSLCQQKFSENMTYINSRAGESVLLHFL